MCIVIHKPAKRKLKTEVYRNSFKHNKDGAGVAYVENRELKVRKGIFDENEFVKFVEEREEQELLIHCRIATHGEVGLDNCHPFLLPPCKQFPHYAYAIAHNGILTWRSTKKQSDTSCFIEDLLAPWLYQNPWTLDQPYMLNVLGDFISSRNKIVIMRYDSKRDIIDTYIINHKQGEKAHGCWFSNTSYLYPRGGAVVYQYGDFIGHRGEYGIGVTPVQGVMGSIVGKVNTVINNAAGARPVIEEFEDWISVGGQFYNIRPDYEGARKATAAQLKLYNDWKAAGRPLKFPPETETKALPPAGTIAPSEDKDKSITVPRDEGVLEGGTDDPLFHLDDDEKRQLRYFCVKWYKRCRGYVLKGKKTSEMAADLRHDVRMLLPDLAQLDDAFLDLAIIKDGDRLIADMETKQAELDMAEAADARTKT